MSTARTHSAFSVYGIELEYMLADRDSLDVLPIADQLLKGSSEEFSNEIPYENLAWSNEFFMHVIELKNPRPGSSLRSLQHEYASAVQAMNRCLKQYGARLMPGGMHPWMDPATQSWRWPHGDTGIYDTYARIFECNTHGWANLQSIHINLPFASDAEFARLHAAIRLVLPLIPALAASSPVTQGKPTGFADFRLESYRGNANAFPSIVGQVIPEPVTGEDDYREQILRPMYREIAAADPEQILQQEWLNSRGAIARFDRRAIEIRLTDTQECVPADFAVATAIIQAVHLLYYAEGDLRPIDTGRLASVLLDCIRNGERTLIQDDDYLQALGLAPAACAARNVWRQLLDRASNGAIQGSEGWRQSIEFILGHGTLSTRILNALGSDFSDANLRKVYRELCDCLEEGRMFL